MDLGRGFFIRFIGFLEDVTLLTLLLQLICIYMSYEGNCITNLDLVY